VVMIPITNAMAKKEIIVKTCLRVILDAEIIVNVSYLTRSLRSLELSESTE